MEFDGKGIMQESTGTCPPPPPPPPPTPPPLSYSPSVFTALALTISQIHLEEGAACKQNDIEFSRRACATPPPPPPPPLPPPPFGNLASATTLAHITIEVSSVRRHHHSES